MVAASWLLAKRRFAKNILAAFTEATEAKTSQVHRFNSSPEIEVVLQGLFDFGGMEKNLDVIENRLLSGHILNVKKREIRWTAMMASLKKSQFN